MHLQNASGHFVGVLTAAAAVFGLGACAGVPDLGTAPGVEPASAFESSASFTAPAAEWPAQEWWKVYNDPQLSALIEEALQGTPTLAQAQARVRKAASTAAESKSALWPHLEIDAKTGEIKQSLNQGFPPEFSQYLPRGYNSEGYLALRLDYEFDFWG